MSDLNIRVPKKCLLRIAANSFLFFLGVLALYAIDNAMGWNQWLVGTVVGGSIWLLLLYLHFNLARLIGEFIAKTKDAAEGLALVSVSLNIPPTLYVLERLNRDADIGVLAQWVVGLAITHMIVFLLFPVVPAIVVWINRLIDGWDA